MIKIVEANGEKIYDFLAYDKELDKIYDKI
jgi:hypothetical protein